MFILLHLAKGSFFFDLLEVLEGFCFGTIMGSSFVLGMLASSSPFCRVHLIGAYPKNRSYQFLDN